MGREGRSNQIRQKGYDACRQPAHALPLPLPLPRAPSGGLGCQRHVLYMARSQWESYPLPCLCLASAPPISPPTSPSPIPCPASATPPCLASAAHTSPPIPSPLPLLPPLAATSAVSSTLSGSCSRRLPLRMREAAARPRPSSGNAFRNTCRPPHTQQGEGGTRQPCMASHTHQGPILMPRELRIHRDTNRAMLCLKDKVCTPHTHHVHAQPRCIAPQAPALVYRPWCCQLYPAHLLLRNPVTSSQPRLELWLQVSILNVVWPVASMHDAREA